MFGVRCSVVDGVCLLIILRGLRCVVCFLFDVCWSLLFVVCCASCLGVRSLFVIGRWLFAFSCFVRCILIIAIIWVWVACCRWHVFVLFVLCCLLFVV